MGFDKIYIWDSKSLKDRAIPLPLKLKERLHVQIEAVSDFMLKIWRMDMDQFIYLML